MRTGPCVRCPRGPMAAQYPLAPAVGPGRCPPPQTAPQTALEAEEVRPACPKGGPVDRWPEPAASASRANPAGYRPQVQRGMRPPPGPSAPAPGYKPAADRSGNAPFCPPGYRARPVYGHGGRESGWSSSAAMGQTVGQTLLSAKLSREAAQN